VLAGFAERLEGRTLDLQGYRPARADRAAWEGLPDDVRRRLVAAGEGWLDFDWPGVRAAHYLDYARTGRQTEFLAVRQRRRQALCDLVLAECVAADGRFLDAIADGLWAICEESYWGNPGALYIQRAGRGFPDPAEPIVELGTGETAALLAWTHFLLGETLDEVSPMLRRRIEQELRRRVLDVCLQRDDFWWMGFTGVPVNNWTPWVCGNWLTTALLVEADEGLRRQAVTTVLHSLDIFLASYAEDGGCDEGPGYWNRAGASLLECLELLHAATGGLVDIYDDAKVGQIGRFPMRAQIAGDWFVNFADAPAIVAPCGPLIYTYGRRIGDEGLARLGAWAARTADDPAGANGGIARQLHALFLWDELHDAKAEPPYPAASWFDGIQVMTAREREGTTQGLFVAAKGGSNAESHNHNDVGNVVIYVDGRPLLVDAGVGAYTAKTFSDERYDIWTMQSGYHNLPQVGGVDQWGARRYHPGGMKYTEENRRAARDVVCELSDGAARFAADIAGAWPDDAGLVSWTREVILERGVGVRVTDRGQMQEEREVALHWLTPSEVSVDGDPATGRCTLRLASRPLPQERATGAGVLTVDGPPMRVDVERIDLEEERLRAIWGEALFRVRLCAARARACSWTTEIARA
jgi:hypothetical protein